MSKEFTFILPGTPSIYTANLLGCNMHLDVWEIKWIDESGETDQISYEQEILKHLLDVWNAEYRSGWHGLFDKEEKESQQEYTGGSSNYYKVFVKNPTTLPEPYEAECNDIIEALKMNFAEGNAFKAIWRKAKARLGVKKKGYDNGLYDSEKVVFFGERMVLEAKESE